MSLTDPFLPTSHPLPTRRLSPRQLECLHWVQAGKSAADIGGIIGISARTVEGHLARACKVLGVRTRIQAMLVARDAHWLERQNA